ncbi:hypothetical protein BVZ80_00956B, partial [Haemophilus influenzae]
SQPPLQSLLY